MCMLVFLTGVFSVNCLPRRLFSRPAKNLPYCLWSAACVAHRILPSGRTLQSCHCGRHSGRTEYIGDVWLKNFHSMSQYLLLSALIVHCNVLNCISAANNTDKWSKSFDIRPHQCSRWTVQSYSPDGAIVPSHEDTLAPPGGYDWTCSSIGPPESTTQTANRSVLPFCTAHGRKSLYFTVGAPFCQNCPFPWGHMDLQSLGQSEPTTQMAAPLVPPFLHRWPRSVPVLCNGPPLPPQNCPLPWWCGPHLIHSSLGPLESSSQTSCRLVEPFLQGALVWQIRPSRSVTIGHICTWYCNVV